MTIQEVVLSGKPFRRKSWWNPLRWYALGPARRILYRGKYEVALDAEDILATDWEVQP